MSTDDEIDYQRPQAQSQHKHHLHHHRNQHSIVSPSTSSASLNPTSSSITPKPSPQSALTSLSFHQPGASSTALAASTVEGRRKSSLTYQYQFHQITSGELCGGGSAALCSSGEAATNVNGSQSLGIGNGSSSNYASVASPGRYGQQNQQQDDCHLFNGRLSLHSMDRYDDSLATCCLPPPSPAPNSDRFIMGVPSPSVPNTQQIQHYDQSSEQHTPSNLKYGSNTLQRALSPSSRYRMSERYREVFPRCDRFVTATHFLANSTPLASNDTYAYLSSAVHTPIKRYVPTPPPLTEVYSDISQSSLTSSQCSSNSATGPQQLSQSQNLLPHQHSGVSSLPYHFRMKCCSVADQSPSPRTLQTISSQEQRTNVADSYANAPRIRPIKCHLNGSSSNQQQQMPLATATSSPSVAYSQTLVGATRQGRSTCVAGEYMHGASSVEYLGVGNARVVTPVNVVSEPNSNTCLHCSTIRRTTGVHQTTQTTGPTSPVLQQQNPTTATIPLSKGGSTDKLPANTEQYVSTASPSLSSNQSQAPITSSQMQPSYQCTSVSPQTQQVPILPSHNGLFGRIASGLATVQPPPSQQQHIQHSILIPQPSSSHDHAGFTRHYINNSLNNGQSTTPQRSGTLAIRQQLQHLSPRQRVREYFRQEIAKFFGVDTQTEEDEQLKWNERQKRLAIRRFGPLKPELDPIYIGAQLGREHRHSGQHPSPQVGDRPDILPAQTSDENQIHHHYNNCESGSYGHVPIEKKSSVPSMIASGISHIIRTLNKRQQRNQRQWSRSFAPAHVKGFNGDNPGDMCEGLTALQEEEIFFDIQRNDMNGGSNGISTGSNVPSLQTLHTRQIYMGEKIHGWRTSGENQQYQHYHNHHQQVQNAGSCLAPGNNGGDGTVNGEQRTGYRGTRISPQLLDGVLDNSRRPVTKKIKLFRSQELDDRSDHRPFFTYWINTVQILVLALSLICYGIGPIGIGIEQKSGQVLVTSLSLQTVQHQEQRNVWIGPRGHDLVHLGGKFTVCMRRDLKIMEVIAKTRRQERETACCIRNDDSGCVQSSQADCSVRGLWPTKSISTWKKWSPGESGPGGRISGSVCGLDPKFCDAPASIAPYEWPDDITKWPICRKTNSFSQRFRFKDQTAEHMVCEVIGHPCCTGVFGECRITTREYCDFVNGYFHEEASLCSQVSCLNNVCGMFPFFSTEVPDQFYRLFTSLCLHAGIIHLAITVAFQHIFLADLERLIGPIRTAIVYIGSGLAGNLTSTILVPYKLEVGPLASLAGVLSSLVVLLLLIHWQQLKKPHLALIKLMVLVGTLFGMGTLPWQQNCAGLIAGVMCGMLLTIALVPFVSITKYGRKSKINLIWTCMLFHLFVYTVMFIIFYIFPTEFTSFNLGDVMNGGFRTDVGDGTFGGGTGIFDTNLLGGGNIHQRHHHHGEDIAMNGGVMPPSSLSFDDQGNRNSSPLFRSSFENLQEAQEYQQQQQIQPLQYHRNSKSDSLKSFGDNIVLVCQKNSCMQSPKVFNEHSAVETHTGLGWNEFKGHNKPTSLSDSVDRGNIDVNKLNFESRTPRKRISMQNNNNNNNPVTDIDTGGDAKKRMLLMNDNMNKKNLKHALKRQDSNDDIILDASLENNHASAINMINYKVHYIVFIIINCMIALIAF